MLKNYFSIAVRNLLKQKVYSFINIIGLATGITASILILMHVEDELSYDSYHPNGENTYKIFLKRIYPDHITNYAIIPFSYAPVIKTDIPGVKNYTRILGNLNNSNIVRIPKGTGEEDVYDERQVLLADSTFFDVMGVRILEGDRQNPLGVGNKVVLTEETARKYFGNEDAIGRTIETDQGEFVVSAISENVPDNAHFDFDLVGSISVAQFLQQAENFVNFSVHTYLVLEDGADPDAVESQLSALVDTYAAPQIEAGMNIGYEDYIAAGNGYEYTLTNIGDIHLQETAYQQQFKSGGSKRDVYMFISIAVLIMIIACINFMNLSIARSSERGKEVGIRKTLGSQKSQLVSQFLTESVLISLISLLIGIGLVFLLLPQFNILVEKQLTLNLDSMILPLLLGFAILVGLLSGIYPAFFMSSFNTIYVLKGNVKRGKGGSWLRNSLVIFQFAISIVLIVGTLIMNRQMNFISEKDLGFDRENMLVIQRAGVLNQQQSSFITEVERLNNVVDVGRSTNIPAAQYFGMSFNPEGASEPVIVNANFIADDFAEAMKFEIIMGEGFSEDRNDSLNMLINEQTLELLGTDNPIGMKVRNTNGNFPSGEQLTIIGVVRDFHYMSLREEISPFVLLSLENFNVGNPVSPVISVRIKGNMQETIAEIDAIWRELAPEEPLQYTFLDAELEKLYKSEINSGRRMTTFSICAILIACIGLFGLSAYATGTRTKEIGIRKVMGASVARVVLLLSKEFTVLILIAFALAVPVAWYVMDSWLNGFAYRINVGIEIFLFAGGLTLLIAWITVSYQTIKAAIVNPVNSLRSE